MFKEITILSGPVHSGKTFTFNTGSTAITGRNGCGKSLLVEYLAFVLFGSTALRGKVSDYKNLSVAATVVIKGKEYQIERSTGNCTIKSNGTVICLGTKPCNIRIIAMLGYDYNVYKMGNYAEQLDILGLCKMKPAERKTALDRTLGIGIIDKLIRYCMDTALKYEHEADGIRSIMQPIPDEPIKPEGYNDLSIISGEYELQKKELNEYNRFLQMVRPVEPLIPLEPDEGKGYTIKQIQEFKSQALLNASLIAKYMNLTKPSYTREQLAAFDSALREWTRYEAQKAAYDSSIVICPKCGEQFVPNRVAPVKPSVDKPTISTTAIARELSLNSAWEERERELPKLMSQNIPVFPDNTIDVKIAYEKALTAYYKDMETYEERAKEYSFQASRFSGFDPVRAQQELNNMSNLYYKVKEYDISLSVYNKAIADHDMFEAKAKAAEDKMTLYRQGADSLKEMKAKIKGYVLPSLEKVSSLLLSEMSDDRFNTISIDPDFNILVHGKDINLFSGSEQAMINLAVRLGLGQVLTHKAFNVFIGDEIDASMDKERADLTAECLHRISKYIKQVLLVSHRDIDADQFIRLGE
jgi:DNA repair exonuclease SbcCD ATPase subunit